jgi:hypothetical protein
VIVERGTLFKFNEFDRENLHTTVDAGSRAEVAS